ncbi:hypothetical protein D3OALGA1CA_2344 [Olavius algarvensis associated proteobacterium Delta 3]|nr:hypothetical protein D3OALGB2SA_244 [Olavius algarvensis associated proteobacterium Delta 3]CAB5117229.1 hypothetical protein D3OALGA1CA_2344 [Olavius algarvensis associated proteobacterium Delta 3]
MEEDGAGRPCCQPILDHPACILRWQRIGRALPNRYGILKLASIDPKTEIF